MQRQLQLTIYIHGRKSQDCLENRDLLDAVWEYWTKLYEADSSLEASLRVESVGSVPIGLGELPLVAVNEQLVLGGAKGLPLFITESLSGTIEDEKKETQQWMQSVRSETLTARRLPSPVGLAELHHVADFLQGVGSDFLKSRVSHSWWSRLWMQSPESIARTVTGNELVAAVQQYGPGFSRERASELAEMLIARQFVVPTVGDRVGSLFGLLGHAQYYFSADREPYVLNSSRRLGAHESWSALDVSMELHRILLRLKAQFMDAEGRGVDYFRMQASADFRSYKLLTTRLQRVRVRDLASHAERTAFFVNLYNALVLHGFATRGVPTGFLGRLKFFSGTAYQVGNQVLSLEDIEHGCLRCNRPSPMAFRRPFPSGDERRSWQVDYLDPRIHFALVCGAQSCPPIRVYSGDNLDRALRLATENFLEQSVSVKDDVLEVSMLFHWYGRDFGASSVAIASWIQMHLSPQSETVPQIQDLVKRLGPTLKLQFSPYDWGCNVVHESSSSSSS